MPLYKNIRLKSVLTAGMCAVLISTAITIMRISSTFKHLDWSRPITKRMSEIRIAANSFQQPAVRLKDPCVLSDAIGISAARS